MAEIAYTEMTKDGTLRHPSYLGLREDKRPAAVAVETERRAADLPRPAQSNIAITNRDRVIYPESNITKGQLADYYAAVSPIMVPWVGSRPISLVRCPQGPTRKCFFQKHDAGAFDEAVHHVGIVERDGHEEPYLYVDDADGLMTCVQMGTIEFHGWGARIEDVEKADRLIFDLDPDEGLAFEAVRAAAFQFRDIPKSSGLETFPMLTGGKGVHVVAPLTPKAEWPQVKDFARRLAQAVARSDAEQFTAVLSKARRKGRIFVDYLRNQRGATAIMPYSARTRAGAPVAAPITWREMKTIEKPSHFHVGDTGELLKRASSKALSGWGRADQVLPDLKAPFYFGGHAGDESHRSTFTAVSARKACCKSRWRAMPSGIFAASSKAQGFLDQPLVFGVIVRLVLTGRVRWPVALPLAFSMISDARRSAVSLACVIWECLCRYRTLTQHQHAFACVNDHFRFCQHGSAVVEKSLRLRIARGHRLAAGTNRSS